MISPPAASAPSPTVEEGMREAVATPTILDAFPGLKDRIIGAFGEAAWINKGGITAHGSDNGGRIAMTHDGWAALPALLAEALSPIASALAARERELEEARAERDAARGISEQDQSLIDRTTSLIRKQREWQSYGERLEKDADAAMAEEIASQRVLVNSLRAELATLRASAERMEAALKQIHGLVCEAAMVGFNCADGDWAERMFLSQADSIAAIRTVSPGYRSRAALTAKETPDA